jgi:hypothetical protein
MDKRAMELPRTWAERCGRARVSSEKRHRLQQKFQDRALGNATGAIARIGNVI